jgi:putative iron-dependent peroxidase
MAGWGMMNFQTAVLAPVPLFASSLLFEVSDEVKPAEVLDRLSNLVVGDGVVIGLGQRLVGALGASVSGHRTAPVVTRADISIPTNTEAVWCLCSGVSRDEADQRVATTTAALTGVFDRASSLDLFFFDGGRDLTGYVDGTENPVDNDAVEAAIVRDQGPGMDGSTFVAVQKWVHDLALFDSFGTADCDNIFGRTLEGDIEIEDAPLSAHVKRTAQEDFDPEAFVVRRSMPWRDSNQEGLLFIAYGKSFDAFEALLNRMVGLDDGIVDGLFRFTEPVSSAYFWCPPTAGHRIDLSALN